MKIKLLEDRSFRWFGSIERIPSDEGPRIVVERGHGCNGKAHVDSFTVLKLDAQGEAIMGRIGGVKEIGPCDGSCGNITATPPDGTGFTYPVPSCAEIAADDVTFSS